MVDKITKALRKLDTKERRALRQIIRRIKSGELGALEVKKLKGRVNIYRARKGSLRVIFKTDKEEISIVAIERRQIERINKQRGTITCGYQGPKEYYMIEGAGHTFSEKGKQTSGV